MSLPSDSFTLTTDTISLPYFQESDSPDTAYCIGGVALNDSSQGLTYQFWKARIAADGGIYLSNASDGYASESLITSLSGNDTVGLAFNSNMDYVVGAGKGSMWTLEFYDGVIDDYTTLTFSDARSVLMCIDDPREGADSTRDVLVAYIRNSDNMLCYRLQREKYAVENEITTLEQYRVLRAMGYGSNNRFNFKLAWSYEVSV